MADDISLNSALFNCYDPILHTNSEEDCQIVGIPNGVEFNLSSEELTILATSSKVLLLQMAVEDNEG
jgi:hypothetical protein